jgi:hypothetical protein
MEFGLALIELLEGAEARRRVQERLQMVGSGWKGIGDRG